MCGLPLKTTSTGTELDEPLRHWKRKNQHALSRTGVFDLLMEASTRMVVGKPRGEFFFSSIGEGGAYMDESRPAYWPNTKI